MNNFRIQKSLRVDPDTDRAIDWVKDNLPIKHEGPAVDYLVARGLQSIQRDISPVARFSLWFRDLARKRSGGNPKESA